eukprot:1622326-Pyramimonas_sp.AAC.1
MQALCPHKRRRERTRRLAGICRQGSSRALALGAPNRLPQGVARLLLQRRRYPLTCTPPPQSGTPHTSALLLRGGHDPERIPKPTAPCSAGRRP